METVQTLHPDDRGELLRELGAVEVPQWDHGTRLSAWRALSDLVVKHRQFPNAQWAMPEQDLNVLEGIATSWAPEDPVERYATLFVQHPGISFPRLDDLAQYDLEVRRRRHEALAEIFSDSRPEALVRLIGESPEPFTVGISVADDQGDAVIAEMLTWLGGDDARRDAAQGWLVQMAETRDTAWLAATLAEIAGLDDRARLHAYQSLSYRDEVLDLIPDEAPKIRQEFWQGSPLMLLRSDRVEEVATGLLDHERPRWALSYLSHKAYRQAVPRDLVLRALRETAAPGSTEPVFDGMIAHEVGLLLDQLEKAEADEATLAGLEWTYFGILQHTRPSRALFRRLEQSPEQFVELVCTVFRGVHEQPSKEEEFDAKAAALWRTGYSVLREWRRPPGTRDDGTVDADLLTEWVRRARALLARSDRLDIGDECIGQLLSGSLDGSDGIWPAEAVRDLLEEFNGNQLRAGLEIGRFNARGVTSRGAFEGGRQERVLADMYDEWSRRVAPRWPNTARVLRDLARSYREWAEREDARAEQWRDAR